MGWPSSTTDAQEGARTPCTSNLSGHASTVAGGTWQDPSFSLGIPQATQEKVGALPLNTVVRDCPVGPTTDAVAGALAWMAGKHV